MTITRDDLEGKLREIEDVIDDTAKWSRWAIAGIAVAAVVVIGFGIWRARGKQITVEVYQKS